MSGRRLDRIVGADAVRRRRALTGRWGSLPAKPKPLEGEWEYRNVGEHDFRKGHLGCVRCGAGSWDRSRTCSSKRERRRVTRWEPAPEVEG